MKNQFLYSAKFSTIILIIILVAVFACNTDKKINGRFSIDRINNESDKVPRGLRCDTITTLYTPFHYKIHLTNRFTDSLITSSVIDMKNHMIIEYSIDTILPIILDHQHISGIDLTQLHKAKILRNEFDFIRTPSLYFDLDFLIENDTFNIIYAVRYSQSKKYSFWHHRGLIDPN